MEVHFTKHAREKFKILANHKFSEEQIDDAVKNPDFIDYDRLPLFIAQKRLDNNHVLRVVYKVQKSTKIIITFYPGRRKQYEKS
ncbi:MAG: DUF4258 domain-containing protein [Patescibacteria group bacterium]